MFKMKSDEEEVEGIESPSYVRLYAGIRDGVCERSLLWFTKNPLTRQCGEDEKKNREVDNDD